MRQRTRLVQRNPRNILIMVDGHATVADLAMRFGDENAAQAALAELLASSLIAESSKPFDPDATQPLEDFGDLVEDLPVLTRQIEPDPSPANGATPDSQPIPQPVFEEIELPAPEYESLPPPSRTAPPPEHATQQTVASDSGWFERIKARLAHKAGEPTSAQVDLEPIGRRTKDLTWPVRALLAILGAAVLSALTLVLYPYGRHLPDIERGASAMLQDSVKIGDLGFSFLPRPHLALRGVKVGKDAHLTVATVRAMPDFLTLMGGKKVFHELEFERVSIKGPGLGRLALAGVGADRAGVDIRHIALRGLSVTIGDVLLDNLGGEVMMSAAGAPEKILLHNADNTLKMELQPMAEGYRIAAIGSNWKTPFKPSLTLQLIDVNGELRDGRLDLSKIEGRAYDGQVEGRAAIEWAGGASLTSNLDFRHMNATKLLAALGSDLSAEGELTARLRLEAKADKLVNLTDALRTDASFELKRGAVKGFDLGEAARRTGSAPTRGGETKFEQMTGTLQCTPKDCRLGNLRLSSGLFKSSGYLVIAGNAQLSGGADVELRGSAATHRMPLTISGTAKDPLLTPGRPR